jgi:hypothetical protein
VDQSASQNLVKHSAWEGKNKKKERKKTTTTTTKKAKEPSYSGKLLRYAFVRTKNERQPATPGKLKKMQFFYICIRVEKDE